MAAPSPEARRIATPSWLDLRLVLGVVLVAASVLIGATVVSRASDTHPSVSATRDLAAGTVLHAEDLRIRQVQLPDDSDGAYLGDLDAAIGKTLTRAVARDELVPSAAVAKPRTRTTLTVPFASGAAPQLHTGQRIEVWVSTPKCASVVLLPGVTVQSVRTGSGSFDRSSGGQDVVISVDPPLADRVIGALAIEDAQIRAGVLVGNASAGPTSGAVTTGSPGALPDDLAACAAPSADR